MVFHVQPLTFYNSQTEEICINFPVTQSSLYLSSPSHTLCSNIAAEFASRTAQLLAAPFQDLARRRRRRRRWILSDLDLFIAEPRYRKFRKFSLEELQLATDGFDSRNKIGEGGFGVVYKGILADGSTVAVKRRYNHSAQGQDEFMREVEVSSIALHRNVLQLYGHCITTKELLLVYPYMANGSLASFLSSNPRSLQSQPQPLSWPIRKRIVLGIAKGFAYLHESCHGRIIHRDLKPSNIVLDNNLEPLISDFGLARFMVGPGKRLTRDFQVPAPVAGSVPNHATSSRIVGTLGYMSPEYCLQGQYSEKTDVYAFGITILQLVSGCKLASENGFISLNGWVSELVKADQVEIAVDSELQGEQHIKDEVQNLIKVGLLCLRDRSELRPKMTEIISMLEGTAAVEGWKECCQGLDYLLQQQSSTDSFGY